MDKDKETFDFSDLPPLKGFCPMNEDEGLPAQPLTVGGWIDYDSKFHGIKPSWPRHLLAKIWLKWSGWKFKIVGEDEFRQIVDEQNKDSH